MDTALKGVPEAFMERPAGLTPVSVTDPASNKGPAQEFIYKEHLPQEDGAGGESRLPSALAPGLP